MNRTIRRYEQADLEQLLSVWENASHVGHAFLPDDFLAQERRNIAEVYMPKADAWVTVQSEAETGTDVVVGFIAMRGNEVAALFVEPTFHGEGIGTALIDHVKQMHNTLTVEVFAANTLGRRFYAKCGFVPLSQYMFEEVNEVMLRLIFAPPDDQAE